MNAISVIPHVVLAFRPFVINFFADETNVLVHGLERMHACNLLKSVAHANPLVGLRRPLKSSKDLPNETLEIQNFY